MRLKASREIRNVMKVDCGELKGVAWDFRVVRRRRKMYLWMNESGTRKEAWFMPSDGFEDVISLSLKFS